METSTKPALETIEPLLLGAERRAALLLGDGAQASDALGHARAVAMIVAAYDPDPDLVDAIYLRHLGDAGVSAGDGARDHYSANALAQAAALARLATLDLGQFGLRQLQTRAVTVRQALPAAQAEALRRMLLALVTDPRLVLVVIAEALHRLKEARTASVDEQRRIAASTEALYAPLANRLGLGMLKWELEDYAFRYQWPDDYRRIAKALNERRADRESYIDAVCAKLRTELAAADVAAAVEGRPKHIFSIWRKMQSKGLAFEEVYDIRAVRILVASVADCYAALGIVHGLWPYIQGEFDDYIATPKTNGYRSIHTAVHADGGRTLEVQIRTHEMHERSERGIAAHWRYKEGVARDLAYEEKLERLRNLLSPAAGGADAQRDVLSNLATDLFAERVYVLSPKGDVTELPSGATPVDFAYHLHTDLGHRCRGAKVNGRMVGLDYRLANGDSVEIVVGKHASPSRDWLVESLGFLATRSARSKVRAYFRRQDEGTNREKGREILERELAKLGTEQSVPMPELLAHLELGSSDELCLALGEGELSAAQLSGALARLIRKDPEPAITENRAEATVAEVAPGITVMGIGDLLTHFARCCRPVPPEPIQGYVTVGRGVTIHRADCANLRRLAHRHAERQIPVDWGTADEHQYLSEISVHASDRRGLVRDVSAVLADARLSIERMTTQTDAGASTADIRFTVRVRSVEELERICARLRALPDVVSVRRR